MKKELLIRYYSFINIYQYQVNMYYFSSHKRPTMFWNLWKPFRPTTQPNPPKSLTSRPDPTQPVGRPNPWITMLFGLFLATFYFACAETATFLVPV